MFFILILFFIISVVTLVNMALLQGAEGEAAAGSGRVDKTAETESAV